MADRCSLCNVQSRSINNQLLNQQIFLSSNKPQMSISFDAFIFVHFILRQICKCVFIWIPPSVKTKKYRVLHYRICNNHGFHKERNDSTISFKLHGVTLVMQRTPLQKCDSDASVLLCVQSHSPMCSNTDKTLISLQLDLFIKTEHSSFPSLSFTFYFSFPSSQLNDRDKSSNMPYSFNQISL